MPPHRSGQTRSLWMDTIEVPSFPMLEADTEADVCIVGGGIAGLTTAYLLMKEGLSVVVLDDAPILGGETARTTAHLSNALDDRYVSIERWHGEEGSRLTAESHTAAIDRIESIVQEEKIDCDFRRLDGYLFVPPGKPTRIIDDELDAAHRAGLLQVERLPHAPLPSFKTGPCLRFPKQGQFHPLRYLTQVAQAIVRGKGRIFSRSHVTGIEEDASPVRIRTENGSIVRATDVITATNAPINDNAAIYSKQAPYRTYVIGLTIDPKHLEPGLYWDTLDPYHYVRLQQEGRDTLLIVGGEDHKTAHANDAEKRWQRLEEWTRTHFPEANDVLYRWSGQVQETMDGLAMIGRKPMSNEHVFLATGDSGMGMTHGTIAGILLTDLVLKREHPWATLYDPGRFRLRSTKEFLRENVDTGKELIEDWLTGGEVKEESAVQPGSGAILRKGIHKIALYRDDKGTLQSFSAICPHKGCIVHWNAGEQSWDCPCHGSRFATDGSVLTGPSITGLSPL